MKPVIHFFNIIKFLLIDIVMLFSAIIFLWLNMAGMKLLYNLYNEYANLPYGIVFYLLSYSLSIIFLCLLSLFKKINGNKIFYKIGLIFFIVTFFINWSVIYSFLGIQALKNSLALIQQHTPILLFMSLVIVFMNMIKSKQSKKDE